jgi:hypothetical protein
MGDALIKELIGHTDLESDPVERELIRLIEKAGLTRETVTLEDIREILAEYVQETLLEAKRSYQD